MNVCVLVEIQNVNSEAKQTKTFICNTDVTTKICISEKSYLNEQCKYLLELKIINYILK